MHKPLNQLFSTTLCRSTQTGDELATELTAWGVHFVTGGGLVVQPKLPSTALLAELALSDEARLRLALIPLLLKRPDFSGFVYASAEILPPTARINLQCYYTAAQLLQRKFSARLQHLLGQQAALPDLFTKELALQPCATVDEQLYNLAKRQAELSGEEINWLGTYEHAVQRFMLHLEKQKLWRQ